MPGYHLRNRRKKDFQSPHSEIIKSICDKNKISVVQEYVDVETAKKSGRIGFNEMISFIKKDQKTKNLKDPWRVLLVEKTRSNLL